MLVAAWATPEPSASSASTVTTLKAQIVLPLWACVPTMGPAPWRWKKFRSWRPSYLGEPETSSFASPSRDGFCRGSVPTPDRSPGREAREPWTKRRVVSASSIADPGTGAPDVPRPDERSVVEERHRVLPRRGDVHRRRRGCREPRGSDRPHRSCGGPGGVVRVAD